MKTGPSGTEWYCETVTISVAARSPLVQDVRLSRRISCSGHARGPTAGQSGEIDWRSQKVTPICCDGNQTAVGLNR